MMSNAEPNDGKTAEAISVDKFLENVPPGERRELTLPAFFSMSSRTGPLFRWPAIELYCPNSKCAGFRFADPIDSPTIYFDRFGQERWVFCAYKCRNCKDLLKLYAISLTAPATKGNLGVALKVGEYPLFGPHLSPNVLELLGKDKDDFLKGYRSEAQGLGIAAFAYYRRVVENQRTHIFDQIISAAEHVGTDPTVVDRLKRLREHWRFQHSVDEIKDCLPQVLLIEGKNPLELLHPVLSDTIHDRSDEEALEIASEIRLVLINLAERIALAKTQSEELKLAVAKLSARKAARKPTKGVSVADGGNKP